MAPPFISLKMLQAAAAAGISVTENLTNSDKSALAGSKFMYPKVAVDPFDSTRIAVVFRDVGNSNYGFFVIGTIDGSNNITFETPVAFTSTLIKGPYIAFDPNTQGSFLISYYDSSTTTYYTKACTLSGNVPTFGPALTVSADSGTETGRIWFRPNTPGKAIIITGRSSGSTKQVKAYPLEVSGTSVDKGYAQWVWSSNAGDVSEFDVSFNPNDDTEFVIGHNYWNSRLWATVCTYDDNVGLLNALTLGTATTIDSTSSDPAGIRVFYTADANNLLFAYYSSSAVHARVAAITAGVIGTVGALYSSTSTFYYRDDFKFIYNTNFPERLLCFITTYTGSDLKLIEATLSGTSVSDTITWGAESTIDTEAPGGDGNYLDAIIEDTGRIFVAISSINFFSPFTSSILIMQIT